MLVLWFLSLSRQGIWCVLVVFYVTRWMWFSHIDRAWVSCLELHYMWVTLCSQVLWCCRSLVPYFYNNYTDWHPHNECENNIECFVFDDFLVEIFHPFACFEYFVNLFSKSILSFNPSYLYSFLSPLVYTSLVLFELVDHIEAITLQESLWNFWEFSRKFYVWRIVFEYFVFYESSQWLLFLFLVIHGW